MQLLTLNEFLKSVDIGFHKVMDKLTVNFRYTDDTKMLEEKLFIRFEVNNTTYSVISVPSNIKHILNVHIGSTPGKNLKLWKIKPNDFKGVLYGIIRAINDISILYPKSYGLAIRMPKEIDISKYDFIIRNLLKRKASHVKFDFFKTEKQVEDKEQFQYLFLFRKDKKHIISTIVAKYGYTLSDESIGQFIETTIKDKRYTNTTNLSDKPSNDSRLKDSVPLEEIMKSLEPNPTNFRITKKTPQEIDLELVKTIFYVFNEGIPFINLYTHELIKGDNLLERFQYVDEKFTEKETAIVFDAKRVDEIFDSVSDNYRKMISYDPNLHGVPDFRSTMKSIVRNNRMSFLYITDFIPNLIKFYSEQELNDVGIKIFEDSFELRYFKVFDREKVNTFIRNENRLFLFNKASAIKIANLDNVGDMVLHLSNTSFNNFNKKKVSDLIDENSKIDASKNIGGESIDSLIVKFSKYSNTETMSTIERRYAKKEIKYSDIVIRYTGSLYVSLNTYLRDKFKVKFLNDKTDYNLSKYIESDFIKLKKMMLSVFESETELEEDLYVYRSFNPKNIEEILNKEVIVDPGFLSTTLDFEFAKTWNTGGILMKIKVPKGSNVIPILDRSSHEEEREIILPPLSVLKITKIFTRNERFFVESEYIGNGMEHYHNELEKEGVFTLISGKPMLSESKEEKEKEEKNIKYTDGLNDSKISEKMIDMLKKKQIKIKK